MGKVKTKLLALLLVVAMAMGGIATLTACGNANGVAFVGSCEINDVTYNVTLSCQKSDGEFSLKIKEIPELELNGAAEYDASKGFRFTFTDQNDTIKVPKYDAETSTFSFTYTLVLGDKYGTGDVTLSYKDETFTPGGETFFEPVVFYAFDPDVGNFGMTTCEAYLYLYEDHTFIINASCPLTAANSAYGTYTYDAENNKYVLEYDSGMPSGMGYISVGGRTPSETEAVYNAEKGAYELTIYYNLGLTSTLKLSTVYEQGVKND